MNIPSYDYGRDGRIKNPGKFEGEMLYMPLFWEDSLDGTADHNSDGSFGVDVIPADIEVFTREAKTETDKDRSVGLMAVISELARKSRVVFVERDDGLVCEVGSAATIRLRSFDER